MQERFIKHAINIGIEIGAMAAIDYVVPRATIAAENLLVRIFDGDPNDYREFRKHKSLGSLTAVTGYSEYGYTDMGKGLNLGVADPVIDLHLHPVSRDKSLSDITASFEMLASYIAYHKLDIRYVMGVTYDRLASASRRYGFTVADFEFPEDEKELLKKKMSVYESVGRIDGPLGDPRLIIQSRESFMQRFGTQTIG